jgi:two-component system chemotaxis response regulator CheB
VEQDRSLSLSQEEPVHFPGQPSITCSIRGRCLRRRAAGVLLTGANEDGAQGLANQTAGAGPWSRPRDAQVALMPEAALALHQPDHILSERHRQLLVALERSAC